MKTLFQLLVAVVMTLGIGQHTVLAEESSHTMHGMDHGSMESKDKKKEKKKGMPKAGATKMDHGSMDHGSMDHGSMKGMSHGGGGGHDMSGGMGGMGSMQGGPAPKDARDPHAYSGGLTLTSGPYVLQGGDRLKLADEKNFASLRADRLEAVRAGGASSAIYELQGWIGKDYNRATLKTEGHYENGVLEEANAELYWSRAVSTFWNRQLGVRVDGGEGPTRTWLAFGYQGLAPYWFEVDATAYLGDGGRTALALETEYEVMFTQKLVLQFSVEAMLYGMDDPAAGIGSGLSEASTGLRLAYGFRREFAPYLGVEWAGKFGGTADYAVAAGLPTSETRVVAGVRFWF